MKISAKTFAFILGLLGGAASCMYWCAWTRRLAFFFGASSIVVAALALLFMFGLNVGMWNWPWAGDWKRPANFRAIAGLAAASSIYDFASVSMFHAMEYSYLHVKWWPSHPILFFAASLAIAVFVVFPPAVLAGALLRSIAVGNVSGITAFATTAGGAAVAAAITYLLMAYIGPASTVFLAAAVNAIMGIIALYAAKAARVERTASIAPISDSANLPVQLRIRQVFPSKISPVLWLVCAGSGFSLATFGLTYNRLLAMLFGPSSYVQGSLLAAMLGGIAVGMFLYGIEHIARLAEELVAVLTLLLALALALSNLVLSQLAFAGYRLFDPLRRSFDGQITAQLIAAILVGLVPSIVFGLVFSAVSGTFKSFQPRRGEPITLTSMTFGAGIAIGGCLAEFILFPRIGLRGTLIAAVLIAAGAGTAASWRIRDLRQRRELALLVAINALSFVLMLPAIPAAPFALGINAMGPLWDAGVTPREMLRGTQLIYYRDGRNATIAVGRRSQLLVLNSDGESEGSTEPVRIAGQLLKGHIPMLLHPNARKILVLGLETGITTAAVSRYPVEQIDVVEPERETLRAARFFNLYTHDMLNDTRVHVLSGTARVRVLLRPTRYDVIISSLNHAWDSDIGSLMTVDFYRLMARRLNQGGIFVQSIDTEGILPVDLRIMAATFHAVFSHMQIWTSSTRNLIFVGTRDVVPWQYSAISKRFNETNDVAEDLKSIGMWTPFSLFGAQILGEADADAFTRQVADLFTDDGARFDLDAARSRYTDTTSQDQRQLSVFRRPGPPEIAGFNPERDLDADGAYLLGFAYASTGQSDLAIQYMQRSTMMAPDHTMFWVGLANQYRAAGRITEARSAYERALAMNLNNVEALISLGELRLDEGRLDWTRVLAERALRLAPQDARAHALMNRLAEAQP